MEVSSAQRKVMINSSSQTAATNVLNGQRLEEVDNFKYLWSILSKDGSSTKEIKTRLGQASSVMIRLIVIRRSRVISFPVKMKLCKALVVSRLSRIPATKASGP